MQQGQLLLRLLRALVWRLEHASGHVHDHGETVHYLILLLWLSSQHCLHHHALQQQQQRPQHAGDAVALLMAVKL